MYLPKGENITLFEAFINGFTSFFPLHKLMLRWTWSALGWLYIQFEQSKSIFLVHYITTRGHLIPQACSVVFDKLP